MIKWRIMSQMKQNKAEGDGFDVSSPGDESALSDLNFPTHVSGLESFADLEETVVSECEDDDNDDDQVFTKELPLK